MGKLIGREKQVEALNRALVSEKSELVAVYGRRRVGKTFLVRETYKKQIVFDVDGIPDGSYKEQLANFYNEVVGRSKQLRKRDSPKNWLEAFDIVGEYIDSLGENKKKVLFFDEFPWIYTQRSRFVQMFGHFWNSYCAKRSDLVVVICGSAASFMINKVLKNKKGLHNRVSIPIRLLPFNLHETELFLKSKRVRLDKYSCLQIYMAMGGIPHYLEKINPGDSVTTAINRLCFQQDGLLADEFNQIFASLFDNSENHQKIVEILSRTQKGITRKELIKKSKIPSGGTLTNAIAELEESGFITEYRPYYKKTKETLIRLTDEYSMFYLKFIRSNSGGNWTSIYTSRSYSSWSGFAFENLCLKHIKQILGGLGLSGINAISSSWRNDKAQIDLLIDRSDRVVNICEMKFSEQEFVISKSYSENIQKKRREFKNRMTVRKNLIITFVTTYGVKQNEHSNNIMDNQLKMDVLFERE